MNDIELVSMADEQTLVNHYKELGIMALAIEEHKRTMKTVEDWEFEGEQLKEWRFVGTSLTDKKGGVGFILASNVVLEETIEHDQKVVGRILSIKIRMCGAKAEDD